MKTEAKHFRPGTRLPEHRIAFVLNAGGIGDYIHWTRAIQWAVSEHKNLSGFVVTPTFFADLARLWFAEYAPRFSVKVCDDLSRLQEDPEMHGVGMRFPTAYESMNAIGWHLFPLGFAYYGSTDRVPPEWNTLPPIRGDEAVSPIYAKLHNYAVITVNATSPVRTLPSQTVNEIALWLRSRGVTPVFLGKRSLLGDYGAETPEGINFSLGVDLREKTNLVEAAVVMARAKAVVGLDNGLLHLACCSSVPVVFAFTTADPRHRVPPRQKGAKTVVITPPESLSCRFCQSNMKFLIGHDFRNCVYGDTLCCKLLTSDPFITALERIISPSN